MRLAFVALLAALTAFAVGRSPVVVGAAPVPKHLMKESEATDRAALQGKWKLDSIRIGQQTIPPAVIGSLDVTLAFEIRGDNLTGGPPNRTTTATISLDATRTPKCLRLLNAQLAVGSGWVDRPDMTFGYVFDDGKLLLAATLDALDGTEEFIRIADPQKPGRDKVVLVLVRVKDKE